MTDDRAVLEYDCASAPSVAVWGAFIGLHGNPMSIRYGWLAVFVLSALAQGQTGWKAGAASVTVTPQQPIWMAGFASRDKASERVTADLHVKALALQYRSDAVSVVVTADLIGFRRNLSDVIAERCRQQYGLARDRLVLNASHTHSGPALSPGGAPGGAQAASERHLATGQYTKELLDKIVGLVGRSIENLAPATLEFNQGLAGLAVNRRRSRPNTRQFPGPVDHDVPVLAVRALNGGLRAVLFGYACHATTMAGYEIDADYPGYAQTALEKMYPGVMALFVQGCGADSNPLPRYHSHDPQLIERSRDLSTLYGKVLASAVDLVLRGKMLPVAGPLRTVFEYIEIPFEPRPSREELELRRKSGDAERRSQAERLLRALDAGAEIPERYPYGIQVWQFESGLKFIALSGEVVVDYSLRLKAAHGWEDTWVAGYSNDLPGYIPSKRVLLEGGYETSGGSGGAFSTAVEERIIEKAGQLVGRTRQVTRP